MNQKIHESFDGEIFYKLISVENALDNSVHEPICIRSGIQSYAGKRQVFSMMYYNAGDGAEEIIKNRIISFPKDIRNAIEYHEDLLQKFYNIRIGIIGNDKSRISGEIKGLGKKLSEYLDFVKMHQYNTGRNSFLYLPTCMPGHHILIRNEARTLNFNYEQTEYGAREDIRKLLEINEFFLRSEGDVVTDNFSPPLLNTLPSKKYEDDIDLVKQVLKDEFSFVI